MAEIGFRYATAADIERYYPEPIYPTMRAVALTLDGEPAAIIGLARWATFAQFFSEYREEYRAHLKSMTTLRALKLAMRMVEETPLPVYAAAEENEPDSGRVLTRLGFVPVSENVYQWRSS